MKPPLDLPAFSVRLVPGEATGERIARRRKVMALIDLVKPKFWDHYDAGSGPFKHLFDFRRIWKQAVALTLGVTLLPLLCMSVIDYTVSRGAIESEIYNRTSRLVSNARRTITNYLTERMSAIDFVVGDNPLDDLLDPGKLAFVLANLQRSFQGFVDLGVIDQAGIQRAYVGPYELRGVDYSREEWFRQVLERGAYLSDVFLGLRHVPHLVIAMRHATPDGSVYIVRTTLDTERFTRMLAELDITKGGDAFLINRQGILQTPSRYYGQVLQKIPLPVPAFSDKSEVITHEKPGQEPLVIGYAFIADSPFILMLCKKEKDLLQGWHEAQWKLLLFLGISVAAALLVILGVSTYLVGQVYEADLRRVAALHQIEYANKMASIGRLAAGVAHEINNPLAIINEKAGLIKDLFNLKSEYAEDSRLMRVVDSIIGSVDRCAAITRRLLSFARHMGGDSSTQELHIREVVEEVLGFLHKDAEHRSISVVQDIPDDVPSMTCDRGRLQQVLLNIVNNAFAAMSDGGHLKVSARQVTDASVAVTITDDGCGIPESDLKRIFEPFFSTKTQNGGTGLGLSITYGLVKEMGGEIQVQSQEGQGTSFIVTLPLDQAQRGA